MSILSAGPGNRHLLPDDLDAMLTAAVREESELPDDEAAELTDKIRALVRPAWLLSPVRDAPSVVGGSRIGGLPDLPEGMSWPTVRVAPDREAALCFTAQIDLAEVPGVADAGWLPSSGRLWFFRDEKGAGADPDHVVLYADVASDRLRTVQPPAGLDYLGGLGFGPEPDRPVPVRLHRTLFLTANYKTGWHSQGHDKLAEALDEHFEEDGAGFEVFSDIQRHLEHAAVGDQRWEAMLLGRPTPCPPPAGVCPCGRSTPDDTPGYNTEDGPCAWAQDSLLVLYDLWGDGPLVFTADATVTPPTTDGRWPGTEAWVY
ncbi:DUF1963 domain-containing protein [Thermomonospora cellulosilytica]|uniref:DUF1963 domain-containing protein n=1 Tax=Thermomonospora cellulosilytica TaxID=1411118 RepID=A0A7W3R760_9ACTN|nr:DUF1963 domain-containing protein [Thermomonospora cellulosilytica]MBA9001980.1 hypothetical protein [Thermomonospora cellulosilytica]